MENESSVRYLVVVQFKGDTSLTDLARRVPSLQAMISGLCGGDMEQVFRSPEGLTFGVFFKSAKPIGIIKSVLDDATANGDTFLVTEVGDLAAAKGFGRPATWLQRH
jgi:hypothetical protein